MRKAGYYISAGMLICFLYSCTVHFPTNINTPLFNQKGEVQTALHAGLWDISSHFSYALSDHIGIMANGSYHIDISEKPEYTRQGQLELGSGYFTNRGKKTYYELFGGIGLGYHKFKSFHTSQYLSWDESGDYKHFNIFVQPGFGIKPLSGKNHESLSFGIAAKISRKSIASTRYFSEPNFSSFIIEPVLTLKFGDEKFKIVFQGGYSYYTKEHPEVVFFPLIASTGVQLHLGQNN